MNKNKDLMIKKLIEYKKEKDLKEKINKVKPYKLPDIEWVKKDKEKQIYDLLPKLLEKQDLEKQHLYQHF